jgi:hypothetical protein
MDKEQANWGKVDRLFSTMDVILNGIRETLEPIGIDQEKEKKIREKDEKPMMVECLHRITMIHTNGSVECFRCHKMVKVIEPKRRE